MLYVVPTPIGNLEDFTFRAIQVLKEVDLILVEDTRVSKKLLDKYDIEGTLESFHNHNEHSKLSSVIQKLSNGHKIALISDAGTPGISDPGFLLVREAIKENIEVSCLPGPTAVIPALVMSGLPYDKFFFEGFLPHKKGKKTRLEFLLNLNSTFCFYESPHRIIKSLKMILELDPHDRPCCVVREISKIHEECLRGTVSEVISMLESKASVKGEIVGIIGKN